MPQYKRPPITETVIDIRCAELMPPKLVDELAGKFKRSYPKQERTFAMEVQLQENAASVRHQFTGYKLTSADGTEVVIIEPTYLASCRFPPYPGWPAFREKAEENWARCKAVAGYRRVQRLAVRYINRIDVPIVPGPTQIQEYLKIYPEVGDWVVNQYTMQLISPLGLDGCQLVIHTNIVPSPLIGHGSVVFDIDVSKEGDVPQKQAHQ